VPDGTVHELGTHPSLATLPSFQEGGFYLQDPSTLLAVEVLDPQPGESLLDLCAAPGGKTTYAAQKMNDHGRIVAHDPSEGRLRLLHENCTRLGIGSVTATTQLPPPEPVFDRILVDAPCSNTGVLRRRVELRWRIQPGEIPRLAKAQLELLSEAARRIRPGGCLVYSTCSLEPEENGGVVQQFLAAHSGFQLESERALHPLRDWVDGAFVARLRAPDSPSTGLPR
jgi:16S rRNA (cytosine967-C5)-methyltransferase